MTSKICKTCQINKELKEFYATNKATCKGCLIKRSKEYKESNPEKKTSYVKNYYLKNKENIASWHKDYYAKNRKRIINQTVQYNRKARKTDLKRKVSDGIRSLINSAIRNKNYLKKTKTEEILGCSFAEFKTHLENQFKPGMSWENRFEWHIDHRIPLASAKTEEEVLKLNHYTNLQPLWAHENLSKGAKIESRQEEN